MGSTPRSRLFNRFQRFWQRFRIFLFAFLLTITQNYWLFVIPAVAQTSPLLRVTNQFIPPGVAPGISSILRIRINNDGGTTLNSVSFVNPLATSPSVLIIPATPAIVSDCGGSTSSTPGSFPGTAGSVSLAGGTVAAGSFCTIDVPVQGFTSGNYIETITAGSVTSVTINNQDPSSATLQVLPSVPATLTKAFAPNTIPGDGRARVTITLGNTNTYALTGTTTPATLTDNLPANVTVDSRTGAITPTTNCAGGTVNVLAGNAGVALVGGTIPAGGSCTITFDATSSTGGTYANIIPVNTLSTVNKISNSNAPTANLNVQTQISLAKAFGVTTLNEEQSTSLTITVTNGGGALTNATLNDNLPAPLVLANTTATTNCTPAGSSQTLAVAVNATSFTLNNGNVGGGSAQVPGSNPSTNALGTCTVVVNVKPGAGTIANLGGAPTLAVTNTIPANALGNSEGRSNATAATAPMTVQSGLVATKGYQPSFIAPGSTTRVTIRVNNRSGVATTGVGYTDNLPSGLTIANPPNSTVTAGCGGGIVLPALVGGDSSVTLTGANVAIGANCDVSFDVTANAAVGTNFDNVIANNAILNNQGLDSDGVTGTEGRVTVASRVTVSKTFNPTPIRRGLASVLQIGIANNRRSILGVSEPLTNVALTDNLPANLQVANPASLNTTNCGGSITGATPGSTSISLVGGNISPVTICTISLNVIEIDQTQANFPTPITYNNTPNAFSNAEAEGAVMPTAVLNIISPLAPSKAFQSPSIAANGISSAVITLSNSLPIALTNAAFNDIWTQANVKVASLPNASTTCLGGNVAAVAGSQTASLTGATIPAQVGGVPGLCTMRFDVQMDGTGSSTFVNSIPAAGITTAESYSNPTVVNATLTRVVSSVSLVKSTSPTNISVGEPSILTIVVSNPASGIDLTNLGFVDIMPAGMIFSTSASPSSTCTGSTVTKNPSSNSFTLAGASLNAGNSCNVVLPVTLNVTGNRTNTIGIGAITSKEGVTNNTATSSSISGGPAFAIAKAFSPAAIAINNPSTLTITITNKTAGTATGLTVTDPLPANMVVASPPGATTTCASGTVNPNAGDTSVVMNGGVLAANANCKVTVRVTSAIPGTYLNTIPAGNLTSTGGYFNHLEAVSQLTVSSSPQMLLVKRITRINSTNLTNVVDDPGSTADNNAGWPIGYLKGEIKANIQSNDLVEYTIYFLNANLSVAKNVRVCDRLTANQTYMPNSFNGLTPTDGGTSGAALGMALALGNTNPTAYLTNVNDSPDRGQFVAASATPIPASCGTSLPNVNGLVIVDVTRSPDVSSIPNSTGAGKPASSYGYVRFRTLVN
jgi:uncharacterized repeat protein (TIGR01451 family)